MFMAALFNISVVKDLRKISLNFLIATDVINPASAGVNNHGADQSCSHYRNQ
jgi:hypothetical protein